MCIQLFFFSFEQFLKEIFYTFKASLKLVVFHGGIFFPNLMCTLNSWAFIVILNFTLICLFVFLNESCNSLKPFSFEVSYDLSDVIASVQIKHIHVIPTILFICLLIHSLHLIFFPATIHKILGNLQNVGKMLPQ